MQRFESFDLFVKWVFSLFEFVYGFTSHFNHFAYMLMNTQMLFSFESCLIIKNMKNPLFIFDHLICLFSGYVCFYTVVPLIFMFYVFNL